MFPYFQPDCIRDLNQIELNLIRLIVPVKRIIYLKQMNRKSSGASVSLPQDVSTIATSLPRRPFYSNIFIIRSYTYLGTLQEFKIRRSYVSTLSIG